MKILNRLTNDTAGLTLFELLIAVSLFTIVMVISTSMFLRAIESQSRSISSKSLQESLNYALAYMVKDASDAIKDPTSCNGSCVNADEFFCVIGGDQLVFRKTDDTCVMYEEELDGTIPRLKVTYDSEEGEIGSYLTPNTIRLTDLDFNSGSASDSVDYIGEVTMLLVGQSLTGAQYSDSLRVQTSVAVGPSN